MPRKKHKKPSAAAPVISLPTQRPSVDRVVVVGMMLLFFLSGSCGLIYQVVWNRLLRLVMGNTIWSLTTVLCAFMGGLALGSFLGGRWIDRRRHPLLIYAALEAVIGIYCIVLPYLVDIAQPLYRVIYQEYHNSYYLFGLLRFFFSGAILLIPATLMGATLPVLVRFFGRHSQRVGTTIGRLYAINTLGAAAGAFAAGFALIPAMGVSATIHTAAAINLIVATCAYLLHRRARRWEAGAEDASPPERGGGDGEPTAGLAKPAGYRPALAWVLLVGYGLSGAAALSYEIVWTRLLAMSIGSTVYAFSLMLSAFILGLGAGSLIISRWADGLKDPMGLLAGLEAGIGISALGIGWLLGVLPFYFGQVVANLAGEFWQLQAVEFGLAAVLMLIPTLLMGAAFPVAALVHSRNAPGLGRPVGSIYAANTLGSIFGSFVTGFVLIPALGLRGALVAAAAVNVLLAGAFLPFSRRSRAGRATFAGATCAALVLAAALLPRWDPALMIFGHYQQVRQAARLEGKNLDQVRQVAHEGRILLHREGIFDTVTVREVDGQRILYTNGKPDASSGADMKMQQLSGHIAVLLHPDPKDVLVVGLASGVTAGSCLLYSVDSGSGPLHTVESLDCVEISPDMVEACRLFDDVNHNVLDNPRMHLYIADGRNHLALTDRKYDVITSEPPNPWLAGVADLFTREYYQLCSDRLKPGGLAACFLHGYAIGSEAYWSVIRAFSSVFEYTTVWEPQPLDFVMIGSHSPITLDVGRMRHALADPSIRKDLAFCGLDSRDSLVGTYLFGGGEAMANLPAAPIHTDDSAIVEFQTPRGMYSQVSNWDLIRQINSRRGQGLEQLQWRVEDPNSLPTLLRRAEEIMRARRHSGQGWIDDGSKDLVAATREFRAARELNPDDAALQSYLNQLLLRALDEKDLQARLRTLRKVLEIDPLSPAANGVLADCLIQMRRKDLAERAVGQAIRGLERDGMRRCRQGRYADANTMFSQAIQLGGAGPVGVNQLAWIKATAPDPALRDANAALSLAKQAVRMGMDKPTMLPAMMDTLAAAQARAGQFDQAVQTAERALQLAQEAHQDDLILHVRSRLEGYRAGRPYTVGAQGEE